MYGINVERKLPTIGWGMVFEYSGPKNKLFIQEGPKHRPTLILLLNIFLAQGAITAASFNDIYKGPGISCDPHPEGCIADVEWDSSVIIRSKQR